MKIITGYIIEHIESGYFVGRENPTYAMFSDSDIAYKRDAITLPHGRIIDHYAGWLDSYWFAKDENKAKLFDSHVHIRRALGLGKFIREDGATYNAYRVHGTDGTIVPLMDIF